MKPLKQEYFNTPSAKRTTHIFRGWHSWLTYARHSQRGACELHINLLNKITINKPLKNTLLCINLFSLSFDPCKPLVAWNLFLSIYLLQIGSLSYFQWKDLARNINIVVLATMPKKPTLATLSSLLIHITLFQTDGEMAAKRTTLNTSQTESINSL